MRSALRSIVASLALALAIPAAALASNSRFQAALDALGVPLSLPPSGKAIVVNIPAFEMIAFEDAEPVLRSRVIVGTPWNRTPVMTTHTTSVRFRPTWRPTPAMIASGEYLDRVWPASPNNPLGLAAVRLEEGLLVYLHDTNRRDLFDRDDRALSHGCVRVQAWDALSAFVLDTDLAVIHALANGRSTTDVPTEAIPVILGYYRVFPDDAGRPVAYDDVYGLGRDGPVTGVSDRPEAGESCGK